jgi:hypothetical protein
MQIFPNTLAEFIDRATGRVIKPWIQYLQQFTQAPAPYKPISVGTSPFTFTAAEPGFLCVLNGTVTTQTVKRGSISLDITGIRFTPVGVNDTVTITYSTVPTVFFIPSFGAATTS